MRGLDKSYITGNVRDRWTTTHKHKDKAYNFHVGHNRPADRELAGQYTLSWGMRAVEILGAILLVCRCIYLIEVIINKFRIINILNVIALKY